MYRIREFNGKLEARKQLPQTFMVQEKLEYIKIEPEQKQ